MTLHTKITFDLKEQKPYAQESGQIQSNPFFLRWLLLFQPAFVNNPLCGLLILVATFLPNWKVGIGMVVGGSIATIAEMVRKANNWKEKKFLRKVTNDDREQVFQSLKSFISRFPENEKQSFGYSFTFQNQRMNFLINCNLVNSTVKRDGRRAICPRKNFRARFLFEWCTNFCSKGVKKVL